MLRPELRSCCRIPVAVLAAVVKMSSIHNAKNSGILRFLITGYELTCQSHPTSPSVSVDHDA
jgi:hypothetical protein